MRRRNSPFLFVGTLTWPWATVPKIMETILVEARSVESVKAFPFITLAVCCKPMTTRVYFQPSLSTIPFHHCWQCRNTSGSSVTQIWSNDTWCVRMARGLGTSSWAIAIGKSIRWSWRNRVKSHSHHFSNWACIAHWPRQTVELSSHWVSWLPIVDCQRWNCIHAKAWGRGRGGSSNWWEVLGSALQLL